MKKYFSFIAFLIFILLFSVQSFSQVSFQVGAGLGYSIPSGNYSGTTIDFYNGSKYGMKSGFNLHAKARLSIILISAFGELGYTTFSGSGESAPGQGAVDLSHKILSVKLGPEYQLSIPLAPITPYIQGFVSFNSISGTVEIKGVSEVPSGKYDLASASRIGIGIGGGFIINLLSFKLDANIQYHAMNISGKEYKIETPTSHARLDNYTSLNDAKDPSYAANSSSHFIKDDRGMNAIELKLSVMFGL